MKQAGHGLLLATIAISMFLDGLDGTIVNVALPEIADYYGIGTGDTSWVITVYYLVMAGLILVFGRISDRGAIRKVLITGMAMFTLGSLFCGLSPSFAVLLASRAFQGVGAAMLAVRCGVPILPVYVPEHKPWFRRTTVVIGEPYMPQVASRKGTAEEYDAITADLMERIRKLGEQAV